MTSKKWAESLRNLVCECGADDCPRVAQVASVIGKAVEEVKAEVEVGADARARTRMLQVFGDKTKGYGDHGPVTWVRKVLADDSSIR